MHVLIAEDEPDILEQYLIVLERSGHKVVGAKDGEECLKIYHEVEQSSKLGDGILPFDVVVLDYRMPKKDGIEVATEIIAINSRQRIIFASAFVEETFLDLIKNIGQIVEIMQKPFKLSALVDAIEDKEIYAELEKLNVDISVIKDLHPTHTQVRSYFEALRMIQKGRTY